MIRLGEGSRKRDLEWERRSNLKPMIAGQAAQRPRLVLMARR